MRYEVRGVRYEVRGARNEVRLGKNCEIPKRKIKYKIKNPEVKNDNYPKSCSG